MPASSILKAPQAGDLLLAIDTPAPVKTSTDKLMKALEIVTIAPLPKAIKGNIGIRAPIEKAIKLTIAAPQGDPSSSGFKPTDSFKRVSKATWGFCSIFCAIFLDSDTVNHLLLYTDSITFSCSCGHCSISRVLMSMTLSYMSF